MNEPPAPRPSSGRSAHRQTRRRHRSFRPADCVPVPGTWHIAASPRMDRLSAIVCEPVLGPTQRRDHDKQHPRDGGPPGAQPRRPVQFPRQHRRVLRLPALRCGVGPGLPQALLLQPLPRTGSDAELRHPADRLHRPPRGLDGLRPLRRQVRPQERPDHHPDDDGCRVGGHRSDALGPEDRRRGAHPDGGAANAAGPRRRRRVGRRHPDGHGALHGEEQGLRRLAGRRRRPDGSRAVHPRAGHLRRRGRRAVRQSTRPLLPGRLGLARALPVQCRHRGPGSVSALPRHGVPPSSRPPAGAGTCTPASHW